MENNIMGSAASGHRDGVTPDLPPTAGAQPPSFNLQPVANPNAPRHGRTQLGSECAIQTLYEGPPTCNCCKNWVEEYPQDLRIAVEEQDETKQKALVVRMRKNHDEGRALELDSVVVQSASLKETLWQVFKGYQGITPSLKKLVFRAPFHLFFYRWALFRKILQRQRLKAPESARYTQLLYDVLDNELRDVMTEVDDLVAHGVITYPLLWALFETGTLVVANADGQPDRFYIVEKHAYIIQTGSYLAIDATFVDWDGTRFGYAKTTLRIWAYSGTRNITELGVVPASLCPSREERETNAIARGRLFMNLRGFHHVGYSGPFQHQATGRTVNRRVDGRIIVDAASYFDNASERVSVSGLDSKPIIPQLNLVERGHIGVSGREMPRPTLGTQEEEEGEQSLPAKKKPEPVPELTDEQLLLCGTHVRGYSLKLKKWGKFEVTKVGDIRWNDGAFPNLMLPGGYKDLILSFVAGQASSMTKAEGEGEGAGAAFDDLIEGKGLGLVMLLAGNPGTGKTLTAEAVADKVRRPLYVLSAGELGQTAEKVEERLSGVLRLIEAWDAVLLFDECDVFLQERSHQNLSQNEVVAVFLRVLEYYRGILLMTTNRADSIDRAFKSRIHLTLQYPDLEPDAKEHIWRQFIAQSAGDNSIPDETYARLAQLPVNGRQIKNVVKSATLLAGQQKTSVGVEQIRIVLRATGEAEGVDI